MSRETDALQAVLRASSIKVRITSITSAAKGRATGTYHGRKATPSTTDKVGVGLAIDAADDTGDKATAAKLATFNYFADNYGPLLAELFYSHASFFIKNGRRYPIATLNRDTFNLHKNHVHIAVPVGVILVPLAQPTPPSQPLPAPTYEPEAGMPTPTTPMDAAPTPSGKGTWKVQWDGGVITSGDAQFYGSMGGKPNPHGFVSIAPTITGRGYWLLAEDGGVFAFGDAEHLGSYWSIKAEHRQGIRSFVSLRAHTNGDGWCAIGTDGTWWHVTRADRDEFAKRGTL